MCSLCVRGDSAVLASARGGHRHRYLPRGLRHILTPCHSASNELQLASHISVYLPASSGISHDAHASGHASSEQRDVRDCLGLKCRSAGIVVFSKRTHLRTRTQDQTSGRAPSSRALWAQISDWRAARTIGRRLWQPMHPHQARTTLGTDTRSHPHTLTPRNHPPPARATGGGLITTHTSHSKLRASRL